MTSAEYLDLYHGMIAKTGTLEELKVYVDCAAELRKAYLLMKEVEEGTAEQKRLNEQAELVLSVGRKADKLMAEREAAKPTRPYLELVPRDPVKMQADKMKSGDVYRDDNGDICVWAPSNNERSRNYSQCCWFDSHTDRAVTTDQAHMEVTVVGRLKAVYSDKGG